MGHSEETLHTLLIKNTVLCVFDHRFCIFDKKKKQQQIWLVEEGHYFPENVDVMPI